MCRFGECLGRPGEVWTCIVCGGDWSRLSGWGLSTAVWRVGQGGLNQEVHHRLIWGDVLSICSISSLPGVGLSNHSRRLCFLEVSKIGLMVSQGFTFQEVNHCLTCCFGLENVGGVPGKSGSSLWRCLVAF